jgi:hypothetical protein
MAGSKKGRSLTQPGTQLGGDPTGGLGGERWF